MGTWCVVAPKVKAVAGALVVIVSSNSAKTRNGRAGVPSEDGAPGWLPAAVGRVPLPVIADSVRAALPDASRYFVTKLVHGMGGGSALAPPNSTGTVHGPISNSARPANSGPHTLMLAPRVMLKLIVPNQPRSMWMP